MQLKKETGKTIEGGEELVVFLLVVSIFVIVCAIAYGMVRAPDSKELKELQELKAEAVKRGLAEFYIKADESNPTWRWKGKAEADK